MKKENKYSMTTDKQKLKFSFKEDALTALVIVLACFIQSFAINGFYVPHQFISGGITGISLLFSYLFELPTWITILALNIPVCLLGWRYLDGKLVIMSIFATFVFSWTMTITEGFVVDVSDPILAALAGGIVFGVSSTPVFRRNATMGGMDILAAICSKRFDTPVGTFLILFNLVIMSVLGVLRGVESALVSILGMVVANVGFNYTMRGFNRSHTVFIVSDKWEAITPHVLKDLHRGATYIYGEGAFTGQSKKLMFCALRTSELYKLKRIVKEEDPNAMFAIVEAKEVVGRGFSPMN